MAKVLIVDDASFMRHSLKYILESAGYNVVDLAENGKDALQKLKERRPDLITIDILMPEMDGLELLREIKKESPSTKAIMVTALGQEQKQKEAADLGAEGYIRKPFKKEQVIEEIERVIGKAEAA